MQTTNSEYIRNDGATIREIANRILEREDNIYKREVIKTILDFYCDECRKALMNGEKLKIAGIGTLTPRTHTPKSIGVGFGYGWNDSEEKQEGSPYMDIRYIMSPKLKKEMNKKFCKNIKKGFAGLSEHCECNTQQKTYLIRNGYLEGKVEDEESK